MVKSSPPLCPPAPGSGLPGEEALESGLVIVEAGGEGKARFGLGPTLAGSTILGRFAFRLGLRFFTGGPLHVSIIWFRAVLRSLMLWSVAPRLEGTMMRFFSVT